MLPKIDKLFTKKENKKISKKIHPEFDYLLKFDGCSKGNPGLAGAGAVIYYQDKEIWFDSFFVGEKSTNNHAEYAGLILGLQQAKFMDIQNLRVEGDSQLVINQMKGIYRCQSRLLLDLYDKAKELESFFEKIEYFHIYRKDNKRADQLANIAVNQHLENEYIYEDIDYDDETVVLNNQKHIPNK
jgi:ribonuclease HI